MKLYYALNYFETIDGFPIHKGQVFAVIIGEESSLPMPRGATDFSTYWISYN